MDEPYFLVTTGGGGDGEALVDWVLRAYEEEGDIPLPSLIAFGPFMQPEAREEFSERIEKLDRVEAITFDAHFEYLMERAAAVVAMGGYNTFCEILSFDKPSLIVPRTKPRREQFIRAARAQELGLLAMLDGDGDHDAARMATALRRLTQQGRPSDVVLPGLLDGLPNINRLVGKWLGRGRLADQVDLAVVRGRRG
jgi:predicted glycosyltransferase